MMDQPSRALPAPPAAVATAPDRGWTLAAGEAVDLETATGAWQLRTGALELYAAPLVDAGQAGTRHYLGRLAAGSLVPALRPGACRLVAVAVSACRLDPVEGERPREAAAAGLREGVERWVATVCSGLVRWCGSGPVRRHTLAPGESLVLRDGGTVSARQGLVWALVETGSVRYMGSVSLCAGRPPPLVPLCQRSWLEAHPEATVAGCTTADLLARADWLALVLRFTDLATSALAVALEQCEALRAGDRERRWQHGEQALRTSLEQFATVISTGRKGTAPPAGTDSLLAAATAVGQLLGLEIVAPRGGSGVEALARASRVRSRQVVLRGRWWREDNGPLVAFLDEARHPVALLPDGPARYRLLDPRDPGYQPPVDATLAGRVAPVAHTFYPALPDKPLGIRDLLVFGLARCRRDLVEIVLTATLGALVGLVAPVATLYIINTVIPGHDTELLFRIAAALLVALVAGLAVKLTGDIAALRLEGRIGGMLQGAVVDRLLRLPMHALKRHSTAMLTLQVNMVEQLRRGLTQILVASVLALIFALVSAGLLVYFSPAAALVALAMTALLLGVTTALGLAQYRALFQGERLEGNVNSVVFQIISNITLLRTLGAEPRAFAHWAGRFLELRARLLRSGRLANLSKAFGAGFEVLTMAAVFAAVALANQAELGAGTFLAFIGAFTTFMASAMQLSGSVQRLFQLAPMGRIVRPLLAQVPETTRASIDPGPISGAIEVSNVSFQYTPGGSWVLRRVSLQIAPGEFVAFVGPSGSGKSTLMRLLLGLEVPTHGSIYYDRHELGKLDLQALRRQLGVVLQRSSPFAGSIYENIAAAADISLEQAWEAARRAGLARDIEAMPMGMHTVLTEGTAGLSGGQIQRLLIARALAARPNVLIFDEATSALDERAQEAVTATLSRLSNTRIAIAHRLSTIRSCDRIFVLEGGAITQVGTFDELAARPGLFAELVRRQLG